VEATDTRKNFSAASDDRPLHRFNPTSANAGSETVSSAMVSVIRSREAAKTSTPVTDDSSRKWYSPVGIRSRFVEAADISTTMNAPPSAMNWKMSANRSAT
jgi:hypothetical protein